MDQQWEMGDLTLEFALKGEARRIYRHPTAEDPFLRRSGANERADPVNASSGPRRVLHCKLSSDHGPLQPDHQMTDSVACRPK